MQASSLDLAPTIAATVLRDLVKPHVDQAMGFTAGPVPVPTDDDIYRHTARVLERYDAFDKPEQLWDHLEGLSLLESSGGVFF